MAQVKHIQEEYQRYMERVRGRAQGAIDQANAAFQARRGDATAHLDAAVHFLQSRFFPPHVRKPWPWPFIPAGAGLKLS